MSMEKWGLRTLLHETVTLLHNYWTLDFRKEAANREMLSSPTAAQWWPVVKIKDNGSKQTVNNFWV